jgi:iron complex outermembrane receptor protein
MRLTSKELSKAVRYALYASAATAVGLTAAPVFAQSEAGSEKLETIVVTGSRIRSADVETSQPVFTMTQADIQKTGLVNVGDILAKMTSAGTQTFSKASVLASNPEQGGQYVNIRNLGEPRTLVLVNGKRWATSLAGFTDLSTIPAALVERLDVLKDGASAIYGSDAIAGVVNIILKQNYNGAEASVYFGQNDNGDDGQTEAYSLTLGTSDEKSSFVFGANYTKEDPIWAKTRNETLYSFGPNHATAGLSGTGPWGRFRLVDPVTGAATGPTRVLNHTGSFDGVGIGADSRDINNYHGALGVDDYFNSTSQMNLAGENEAKTIFSSARYDYNDYVSFKVNAMYNERDNTRQVAGYPLNSLSQPNSPVYVSGDSYYNPLPGQDLFFYRRTIELPRITKNNVKSYHFDAGFDGGFTIGDRNWNWDVGFNYNKYDVIDSGSGNLNLIALRNALGPSFLNPAGVVQCGTPENPIATSQCVPFNILGGPSASTPEALAYINSVSQSTLQSLSREYSANITGGLFDGWAGEISMAAGVEHRELSGYDHLDQLVASGATTDLAGGNTDARYSTNEFYLEFNVPVLKDLPFAKELSFDIASRYSDYSNFGSTTNSKYSFKWKPIDDLMIRGTYAKGFRAPTLDDTFGGGSQTFDYYTDPCDTRFGASATNPAVRAACRAEGLPDDFRQLATTGLPISAPNSQSTTPFNAGVGNTSLQPEFSTSKTAGFVYSPQWVTGLNINVDWYKIKITNSITGVSANYVLGQCYVANSPTFCSQFGRDPTTGQVVALNRGNLNLGMTSTEGYDFGFSYRLPEFDFGRLVAKFDMNYLVNYKTQGSADADVINYVGQWNLPRIRTNASLDWSLGDFGATWGVRYYGAFRDQCWDVDVECNQPNYESPSWGDVGANRVGAIVFNDVQVRYNTPWDGNIQVGANNVFDRKRPITYSVTNSNAAYYDPALDIDRYFYVRYTQRF